MRERERESGGRDPILSKDKRGIRGGGSGGRGGSFPFFPFFLICVFFSSLSDEI
jgi:hypothetical protein